MYSRERIYEILEKHWGYGEFRPVQLEVIESVLAGSDAFALMPTGGGKSLLYQLPGMLMDGVCIVVTPLVALMKDQVDALRKRGIAAAAIHSGLSRRQIDLTLDNASWGDLKFLYVAPERIVSSSFRERVPRMNISLIAVDEAHCISQWGYDFRTSYLKISLLRELTPDTPVLALTASATKPVVEDIRTHLGMKDCPVFRASFARPNLSYVVRQTDDKLEQIARVINNVGGSGIVYVRTRDETEKVADWLRLRGVAASCYHAGMPHSERTLAQERWMSGESPVIVSTNAFGMGIDKADVRFVIHYDICDSPEAYYQEAGRAGRDGRRSYAVLLFGSDDPSRTAKRFETEFPPIEKIKECYELIHNYLQIGIGDGKYASFAFNLFEFAGYARIHTTTAVNCIKILQQNGYMTLTPEAKNPARIMFTVSRDDLYKVRIEREELDHILRTILRLYEGLFGQKTVAVDEAEIAHASGYTLEKVHELLKMLWRLRVIKYIPGAVSPLLILNEERLPGTDVYISPESYHMRKRQAAQRLEAMKGYAMNESRCRSAILQEYFGEENVPDCGACDICLGRKRSGKGPRKGDIIEKEIKEILRLTPATVKEVVSRLRYSPETVIGTIDRMTAEKTIEGGIAGKLRIK